MFMNKMINVALFLLVLVFITSCGNKDGAYKYEEELKDPKNIVLLHNECANKGDVAKDKELCRIVELAVEETFAPQTFGKRVISLQSEIGELRKSFISEPKVGSELDRKVDLLREYYSILDMRSSIT